MIQVSPRARRRSDRSGDPLDGLVNMFDIGIVLAVGFLIASLSSLKLLDHVADHGLTTTPTSTAPRGTPVTVRPGQSPSPIPSPGATVVGTGEQVGTVYRLDDGRLVWVERTPR